MNAQNLTRTKERLAVIVGADGASDDPGVLAGFSDPALPGKPLLLARPADTRQVRDIIKLANASGLGLVFSSSGPPRFRGDTVPSGEAVIVDMSGMDKVVRVDRRNKVALIEPGVTFATLKAAVDTEGLRVLMPLLPRATKSVLGSYLEREPITIPRFHWDMTDPLLCTELVFGTGDLFRTGSAAGPGNLEQQWEMGLAQKNPMGPAQTDFMRIVQGSQGTMAAVTWATVKLELKPSIHHVHFLPSRDAGSLIDFSYRAMRPKLADEFFILNSFALATLLADSPDQVSDLAEKQAPFTLVYGVSGFEYLPEQRVAYQEHDLSVMAQASGLAPAREVPGVTPRKMDEAINNPSPEPYYKLKPKGAFLEIFFLATLDRVPSFISLMESCAWEHDYPAAELGIYVQPIQHGRTCHLEFDLYYDPQKPDDEAATRALFSDASRALSEAGAFFSRPYGEWSDLAYARCPDTVLALKKIKNMLDPGGVLNPGKLCFKGVE